MGTSSYGGQFKLLNTEKFYLNIPNSPMRWLHLATVGHGVKEYIFFMDRTNGQHYIEDITGAQLDFIEDDELWHAIANFLDENGFTTFTFGDK